MVWTDKSVSGWDSALSCFCFFYDWQVGRLGKDVDDSSGDNSGEGDQTKDGGGVVGHQ